MDISILIDSMTNRRGNRKTVFNWLYTGDFTLKSRTGDKKTPVKASEFVNWEQNWELVYFGATVFVGITPALQ